MSVYITPLLLRETVAFSFFKAHLLYRHLKCPFSSIAMDKLVRGLTLIGIPDYLEKFNEYGIDTWEKFLLATEADLKSLRIPSDKQKLIGRTIALAELSNSVAGDSGRREKRKYHRRPKPDENAPRIPPTAYVVFSNEFREQSVEDQSAFSEIAKAVGKAWQTLSPQERLRREDQARIARDKYRSDMETYKKTGQYREYREYLERFRAEEDQRQDEQSKSIASLKNDNNREREDRLKTYESGFNQNQFSAVGSILKELVSTCSGRCG